MVIIKTTVIEAPEARVAPRGFPRLWKDYFAFSWLAMPVAL
jgi:hypothetical protein